MNDRESGFDPEKFGFEVYENRGGYRGVNGDYIGVTNKGKPYISLSEDTYRFIHDLIGDEVGVAMNDKGIVLLFACGYEHRPHRLLKCGTRSCRRRLNVHGLDERMTNIFGKYRRVPLASELYAHGDAIVLKPQMEKIAR